MTERDRTLIDEIMDGFDFARVYRCMEALDWHWSTSIGQSERPTEGDLRRAARQYLADAIRFYEQEKAQCPGTLGMATGSGGFRAHYRTYLEHPPTLRLSFEVEYYEAGEDDEAMVYELNKKGEDRP